MSPVHLTLSRKQFERELEYLTEQASYRAATAVAGFQDLKGGLGSGLPINSMALDNECRYAQFEQGTAHALSYTYNTKLPLLMSGVLIPLTAHFFPAKSYKRRDWEQVVSSSGFTYEDRVEAILKTARGLRSLIDPQKIDQAARNYAGENAEHVIATLKSSVPDEGRKRAVFELLQSSATAAAFHRGSVANGDGWFFVNLTPWSMYSRDLLRGDGRAEEGISAVALCRTLKGTSDIFVDTAHEYGVAYDVIKSGHEFTHAWQNRTSPALPPKYREVKRAIDGKVVNPCTGLKESHSIAAEYIIAAELVRAGCNRKDVSAALDYGLPPKVINLLCDNPAEFLATAARSKEVEKRWALSREQTLLPQVLIDHYVRSMPALCEPWGGDDGWVSGQPCRADDKWVAQFVEKMNASTSAKDTPLVARPLALPLGAQKASSQIG